MKWFNTIIIFSLVILIGSLIIVNKEIYITLSNSSNIDTITFRLNVNENEPIIAKIVRSTLPNREFGFDARLGIQKINVNCIELGINKEIEVFTLFKNYIDIEIVNDLNDENVILSRKSWFKLKFE